MITVNHELGQEKLEKGWYAVALFLIVCTNLCPFEI